MFPKIFLSYSPPKLCFQTPQLWSQQVDMITLSMDFLNVHLLEKNLESDGLYDAQLLSSTEPLVLVTGLQSESFVQHI